MRSSPVRNASRRHVIGSTATERRATSDLSSPVYSWTHFQLSSPHTVTSPIAISPANGLASSCFSPGPKTSSA